MKMILPPLDRGAPDGGPQFVSPAIGQGGTRGQFIRQPLPGQVLPPSAVDLPVVGGITQKVANSLAFAKIIDASLNTTQNQSVLFLTSTDAYRNFLMLRNASGAANLFFGFNSNASTLSTLRLVPGATVLFDTSVPQDDLYVFADAAAGILCFAYSTVKPDWKV